MEIYKLTLKRKADLLTNLSLDESIYIRLRAAKDSNATKANVDLKEKVLMKPSFKIFDFVKPLLFLASREKLKRKSKIDGKLIRIAIRLWATLFCDIIRSRRHNILLQVHP
jgi:hypothetical protein